MKCEGVRATGAGADVCVSRAMESTKAARLRNEKAAALATALTDLEATSEVYPAAVAAGCVPRLVQLLAHGDAAAVTDAATALGNSVELALVEVAGLMLAEGADVWLDAAAAAELEGKRQDTLHGRAATKAAVTALRVLRMPAVVTATLAHRLPPLRSAASAGQRWDALVGLAAVIGAGGAGPNQITSAVSAGWSVGGLVELLEVGGDSGESDLRVVGALAGLCRQAKGADHAMAAALSAAQLDKGRLVAAATAVKGKASASSAASPKERAKHMLEQLLKDTALLSKLADAEYQVAHAAAVRADAQAPLTHDATLALVSSRLAANETDMDRALATEAELQYHEDCKMPTGQQLLADVLAMPVLLSRKHQAAIGPSLVNPAAHCDCQHFVADFWASEEHPWRCSYCKIRLCPERVEEEESARMRAEAGDSKACGGQLVAAGGLPVLQPAAAAKRHINRLHGFAVTVEFLVSITVAFNCWHWPTWKVQRDIIRPARISHVGCHMENTCGGGLARRAPPPSGMDRRVCRTALSCRRPSRQRCVVTRSAWPCLDRRKRQPRFLEQVEQV